MISIVIPVYNNWELTKCCLDSLARCSGQTVEVIVVDNASADKTQRACPLRGERLFGDRFRYIHNEVNRNFAGACNQGAACARGDYVYFLNNDTVVLTEWEDAMVSAFAEDSKLAGLTPLLVYPVDGFGIERVQHVGVTFSPERRVSHLYEYFPADHGLMQKARRFQAVTAAALMMPRQLFTKNGGFDEGFVNGFEDVELCARVRRAGWEFGVTSNCRVRHLCGQSEGRGDRERQNAAHLTALCPDIVADKAAFLRADGYEFGLSEWLTFEVVLSRERIRELLPLLKGADAGSLLEGVNAEPYWMDGWAALAAVCEKGGQPIRALEVWHMASQFRATPEILLPFWSLAGKINVLECFQGLEQALRRFVVPEGERIAQLRDFRKRFRGIDEGFREDADRLLAAEQAFYARAVAPLGQLWGEKE